MKKINQSFKEEIDYFIKEAEQLHINYFFLHTKEELNKYINNYLDNHTLNDKYDLIYMLKSINKYMLDKYDSHSTIVDSNNIWLPLELKIVEDELYIYNSFDSNFNKTIIYNINNTPINRIINELKEIVCYGTNEWFKRCIEIELTKSSTLLSLPSIDSNSKTINFETNKGVLEIDLEKKYNLINKESSNYKLDNSTLIFKYKKCTEENAPDINYINKFILDNNINTFIIDLRNNSGGNETLLLPLIDYLKNSNLKIITIVNKGVFSSTRWNCIDLKNINSIFIGEDLNIGTPLNCFGSNNKSMPSKNYGLTFVFSKWYISYQNNKIIPYKTKEDFNNINPTLLEPIYLQIDKYIPLTKNNYLNDVDITEELIQNNKTILSK